jgi:hypothetical protein
VEPSDVVIDVLAALDLSPAGPVISNPSIEGGVYIPMAVRRDAAGRQIPSPKVLSDVQETLRATGIVAEYHLIDETGRVLEEGLRESLIGRFPDALQEAVILSEEGSIQVWIDAKQELSSQESEAITEHIEKYLELFPVRSFKVHIASQANLPSNLELLALIRRLAPVNCEGLAAELSARQFDVPSLTWINHKFDALRKAGLIVRMRDRTYALTATALHQMGTVKGRNSPDVSRLLFLARGQR